jgi:hypothetical protein
MVFGPKTQQGQLSPGLKFLQVMRATVRTEQSSQAQEEAMREETAAVAATSETTAAMEVQARQEVRAPQVLRPGLRELPEQAEGVIYLIVIRFRQTEETEETEIPAATAPVLHPAISLPHPLLTQTFTSLFPCLKTVSPETAAAVVAAAAVPQEVPVVLAAAEAAEMQDREVQEAQEVKADWAETEDSAGEVPLPYILREAARLKFLTAN